MVSLAILFIFGLAIGSFLNVVIVRYAGDDFFSLPRISGRSMCPHCHSQLAWHDLVPVLSFLWLSGACRFCRARISFQYPVVELLTGFAFVLTASYFYPHYLFPSVHPYALLMAFGWGAVLLALIAISAVDMRLMLIPNELSGIIAFIGLIFAALNQVAGFSDSFLSNYVFLFPHAVQPFFNHAFGGIVGFAFLSTIVLFSRGRAMGMGDVKLAGAMGLVVGFPDIIFALAFSFLVGGIWGLGLVLLRARRARDTMRSMIPFGPFLVAGFLVHAFFGHALFAWYFSLL